MSKQSWGDWFEDARIKTKVIADKAFVIGQAATKIAHEGAIELGKQAKELREKYDLDVAAQALISTLGGPQDTSANNGFKRNVESRKSVLDVVYVTENLISMSFPYDYSKVGRRPGVEGNDINIVSKFLKQRHGSHFMIWNISEETYDYSYFGDQVLEYNFPGHPAPPLGLLFKICTSVENWLDADEKNVAVVHCLTGKGRTAALMSCILTWIGEFSSPVEALQYVAERRGVPVEYLTIPSQRRYVQYFTNMLGGLKPSSTPLLLRRVIMKTIPNYSKNKNIKGCCPYIQVFQCGKLIATAAPRSSEKEPPKCIGKSLQLKWVDCSEGSISFTVDCPVQGDLLIRCRHADPSGARISILRGAFHTGYVTSGILRLEKADLDGACSDFRFDNDFLIDLIFAPLENSNDVRKNVRDGNVHAVNESNALGVQVGAVSGGISSGQSVSDAGNTGDKDKEQGQREEDGKGKDQGETVADGEGVGIHLTPINPAPQQPSDGGWTLDLASTIEFKESSQRDYQFWDAVAARKNKSKTKRSRKYSTVPNKEGQFSISDDMYRSNDSDTGSFLKVSSSEIPNLGLGPVPLASAVTNEELIKQINRLEMDEEKTEEKEKEKEKDSDTDKDMDKEREGEIQMGVENIHTEGSDERHEREYDEDYGMSIGDVYPVEDDFLQVNVMYDDQRETVHTGTSSVSDTVIVDGAETVKSDNFDDFQFYLSSVEPTTGVKEDSSGMLSSLQRGGSALEDSIFGENPLRKESKAEAVTSAAGTASATSTSVAIASVSTGATSSASATATAASVSKSDAEDHDELDELERYLMKLSTT